MILPSDWGQGKNCTLFMFNNVPSADADNPHNRNPRQTGNVRYVIEFREAFLHNITVVIWSEYENRHEIDVYGGILYSIHREGMEFVTLSDTVLRSLAMEDRELRRVFQGEFPADQLLRHPSPGADYLEPPYVLYP